MSGSVFYSWQSDLPNRTNRGLIRAALDKALHELGRDGSLEAAPRIDQDTAGVPGSPDIASTILAKIDAATAFVADVSIVSTQDSNRPTPNPNVLVELGYALKSLGPERIVMVANTHYGAVEQLPFDLRFKRTLTYSLSEEGSAADARHFLEKGLEAALRLVFDHLKKSEQERSVSTYASKLALELFSFLSLAEQMENRNLNPWFESAQDHFKASSAAFRDLAIPQEAETLGIAEDLRLLGKLVDTVVDHRRTFGGENWASYLGKIAEAVSLALSIKRSAVDQFPLDLDSKRAAIVAIGNSVRRLRSLSAEASAELEAQGHRQWREIKVKASEEGQRLLRLSYLSSLTDVIGIEKLKTIAMALHQLEMTEQRTGGRRNIDECLHSVIRLTSELDELVGRGSSFGT